MTPFGHPPMIHGLVPLLPRFLAARKARPASTETSMQTTILLNGNTTAQGLKVAELTDGRVTIETGRERVTGWPVRTLLRGRTVWHDGAVDARPGEGRFLPCGTPGPILEQRARAS